MDTAQSRIAFTLCVSFLVVGLACLPLENVHSPAFVILILSLAMNLGNLILVSIRVRRQVRKEGLNR